MEEEPEADMEDGEDDMAFGMEGFEYVEDGMGIDDYVEFVEMNEGEPMPDALGAVPFALAGLLGFLLGKGAAKGAKYTRDQLVAAMPYLKSSKLRSIKKNPFRKLWVRNLAAAELRRRMARKAAGQPVRILPVPPNGRIVVTRSVPMSRIALFTKKYSSDTSARQVVTRRAPVVRARPMPRPPRAAVPATNAQRRLQEAAAQRAAAARQAAAQRTQAAAAKRAAEMRTQARQRQLAQAQIARMRPAAPAFTRPSPARLPGPRAALMARGGKNEDVLGDLMGAEGDPTIGQSIMAHPFQALLIGTALFGVGALVGKERIIDAGLAVGDSLTGAAHRSVRGARERRAAR